MNQKRCGISFIRMKTSSEIYSQSPAQYRLTAEDATDDMRKRATQMFGAYLTTPVRNASLISIQN